MRAFPRGDRPLLAAVVALAALGVVMVYSASAVLAADRFGEGAYYLWRQLAFALLGVAALTAAALVPLGRLERLARPALALALALLALTLVPALAPRVAGTQRWLSLGIVRFQPAELAKLAIVLWLAARLARPGAVDTLGGLLGRLAVVGAVVALVLAQPDFGTAALLALIALGMLFVAGARPVHLASLVLAALPAVYLLVMRVPYRRARVLAFLDPWAHASGSGWQVIQSFIAFGAGGLFGRGLGEGRQKLLFLPEPHTDFIAAVVAEELGLVGFAVMTALFAVVVLRGLAIARRAPTPFATYLALGATLLVGLQAAINIGVALGCLPTKGLPLPFVSYGGSALVVAMVAAGLLLNVASASRSYRPVSGAQVTPVPGARLGTTRRAAAARAGRAAQQRGAAARAGRECGEPGSPPRSGGEITTTRKTRRGGLIR
jgi:cell division protein FtsW